MIESFNDALKILFKEEKIKKNWLDNIRKACSLLWNPEKNYKIIHIAWTNWKWSVCRMLFSVFKRANKKVWVFTSPHLLDIRERFEIDNWIISKEEFINILNKLIGLDIDLSYFDLCVLIALEFFKLKEVEYVILEAWIWWRLDSTNIITSLISCITNIWFDHEEMLWNTLNKISYEKAWIIKNNIPVVLNIKNRVIEDIATKRNSKIIFTNEQKKTNLLWEFQKKNAALVYEISNYLWINKDIINEGLMFTRHLWRLQMVWKNLLLDWAHNIDFLLELKSYIDKNLLWKFKNIYYCFWIKKWKGINLVIDNIWNKEKYILLDIKNPMLEDLSKYKNKYLLLNKKEILFNIEKNKNNLYIIFWSLYLIWEFL